MGIVKKVILSFTSVVVALTAVFCILVIYGIKTSTTTVTDLSKYEVYAESVNSLYPTGYLPKKIPSESLNTSFFYVPGFLQGATILSLRLKLPEREIDKLLKLHANENHYSVDDINIINRMPVRSNFGKSPSSEDKIFPKGIPLDQSFKIFLRYCSLKSIEKNWNHPHISLIAISRQNSEVVYLYYQG